MRILRVLIALLVLGCGQQAELTPEAQQMPLLTGRNKDLREGTCFTFSNSGVLTVDNTYGTAMANEDNPTEPGVPNPSRPIMWPVGYTAFRVGSEVAVVDPHGKVLAMTGIRYRLTGGGSNLDPALPFSVFYACGGNGVIPEPKPLVP